LVDGAWSESAIDDRIAEAAVGLGDLRGWLGQVERVGGCAPPVYLVGHSTTRDASTGAVLHVFSSESQPCGRLMVACGNRRSSRCEPCAWLHAGDTYQLIVSGLAGGKGVPASVASHPRVFATLTAPSFGAVHRVSPESACRPVRGRRWCAHGVGLGCAARHDDADPLVGSPLCPACYDYEHAVLWNGHATALWDDFAKRLRRRIAASGGVSRSALSDQLRVSFARVAEYQRRGAIHLHAVLRLDGPGGASEPPPSWATVDVLSDAVREAGASALLNASRPDGSGLVLRFGVQLDVKPIRAAVVGEGDLSASAVAGYVAKYVTKGDIAGLVLDARLRSRGHAELAPLDAHGRALVLACWDLGGLPGYEGLLLRSWAHQLGWRGHIATKSRRYSTTYGALRQARTRYQRARFGGLVEEGRETVTVAAWSLDQVGHGSLGEAMLAAGIAEARQNSRELARDAA
jgi:hypothetical protein